VAAEEAQYGPITGHKVLHTASQGNHTLLAVQINGAKQFCHLP
jgi:hypothetical protein